MIVVLIIGILIAIAVPQWANARDRARINSCISNLKHINQAKDIMAMDQKLQDGAPVLESDLAPLFLKGNFPQCPTNGVYTVNPIGTSATCSIANHVIP